MQTTIKKLILLIFSCVAWLSAAALAEVRTPEAIVEDISAKVLKVLLEDADKIKQDPKIVNDLVNNLIVPVVDMEAMGKLILGKYWRTSTEEQHQRFITEFKDMLVRTYAKSLVEYGGAKVKVLPNRDADESKYHTVHTELNLGDGKAPLQVAYIFRQNSEQWKVFDLSVDGLSLIKNFRTSFTEEIKQTSFDALIERLANTNKTGETQEIFKKE